MASMTGGPMTTETKDSGFSAVEENEGTQIKGGDITVDAGVEALFPRLPEQQYEALKKSIHDKGQHVPIYVNDRGIVLDGHHRLRACRELGIEPKFVVKHFAGELDEQQQFVNTLNLLRRNLNPFQAVEIALQGAEIEVKLARKRQLQHLRKGRGEGKSISILASSSFVSPSVEISTNGNEGQEAGRIRERLAAVAGVSSSTFARGKYIVEHGPAEMKQALREGRLHIDPAYKRLKAELDSEVAEVDEKVVEEEKEEESAEETSTPKEESLDYNLNEQLDNLFSMALNEVPVSLDFIMPTMELWTKCVDEITIVAHTTALADTRLKPGKFLAFFVASKSVARVLALVQGQQPDLAFWCCVPVEYREEEGKEEQRNTVDFVLLFRKPPFAEGEEVPVPGIIRNESQTELDDIKSGVMLAAEYLIRHLTNEGDRICDPINYESAFSRIVSRLKRAFVKAD
jgi:ParB-like chromosome segregation protein Spo0J